MGNYTIQLIIEAINPYRYLRNRESFAWRPENLNAALSLGGYYLRDDGKIGRTPKASTLDEALSRANRLKILLEQRTVHLKLLKFCQRELLEEKYFHAVFEAGKSVRQRLAEMSGGDGDGAELVDYALGMASGSPWVAVNRPVTKTEIGEQRDFANLLKDVFGMVRNPLAHNAKIEWDMN